MELTMNNNLATKKSNKIKRCLSFFSERPFLTLVFILSILGVLFLFTSPLLYNSFASSSSDESIQYRNYMQAFATNLKSGSFSFFDLNNSYGNSVFSLTYYVPLDIFTLFYFLASFIFPYTFALNLTEYLMISSGVIVLYLVFKNVYHFSNKSCLLASLLWLGSGSIGVFATYYTYLGLYFYVPFFLFCLKKSHDEHKPILLLFAVPMVMLFNFHLGFNIVLGSVIINIILSIFQNDFKINKIKQFTILEFKKYMFDLIFVILGLLISSAILVPTLYYLLNNSNLDRGTSTQNFGWQHFTTVILSLFTPFKTAMFAFFKGTPGNYIQGQCSLFVSTIGLFYILNLLIEDKKNWKKYLLIFIIEILMLTIPIVSMIFSLSKSLYSRWFFILSFINIYLISYSFEKYKTELSIFKNNKIKYLFLLPSLIVCLFMTIGYQVDKNEVLLISSEKDLVIFSLWLCFILLLLFIFFKKPSRKYIFFCLEGILGFLIAFSNYFLMPNPVYSKEAKMNPAIEKISNYVQDDDVYRIFIYNKDINIYNYNSITVNYTNDIRMFSSFYNSNMNDFYEKFLGDFYTEERWSYVNYNEASFYLSNFLGYRYFVIDKREIVTEIPDFLKPIDIEDDNFSFYYNTLNNGFGKVYNKFTSELSNSSIINAFNLNQVCYYEEADDAYEYLKNGYHFDEYVDNTKLYDEIDLSKFIKNYYYWSSFPVKVYYKDGQMVHPFNNGFIFDDTVEKVEVWSRFSIARFHYTYKTNVPTTIDDMSDVKVYKNGDTFNIQYTKIDKDKNVVVLPITYSKDFKSNEYKIIKAQGSFVGLIIPENVTGEINTDIYFEPAGLKLGSILTLIGSTLSLIYIGYYTIQSSKRKAKLF